MSELVLEHDPDEGCDGCPLISSVGPFGGHGDFWCRAKWRILRDRALDKAPGDCPLRAGDVVVRVPGKKETKSR